MKALIKKNAIVAGFAALILAMPVQASINKNINVGDGETSDGATSVNGSVTIGKNATVTGGVGTVNGSVRIGNGSEIEDANTVNGSLKIGDKVKTEDLETVNGAIRIGKESRVDGAVTAVNGSVTVAKGATIARNVENVNGDIRLTASEVGGDISTVSGDVELADRAVVKGDIVVEENRSFGWGRNNSNKPKIVIGPGSRVEGVIRLEREVKLYISETAEVGGVEGEMSMNDAIRFSGKKP